MAGQKENHRKGEKVDREGKKQNGTREKYQWQERVKGKKKERK